jgi:hypothetical protein
MMGVVEVFSGAEALGILGAGGRGPEGPLYPNGGRLG